MFLPKKIRHLLSKSELQNPERPPEISSFYIDFSNCHLYLSASLPGSGNHQLECTNIHRGRFVTISKSSSTSTLALCEVQVFGSKYPLFDTYLKTHWFVLLLINLRNYILRALQCPTRRNSVLLSRLRDLGQKVLRWILYVYGFFVFLFGSANE